MKTEWMGPVERSFNLFSLPVTRPSGFAQYRLVNEAETLGYLDFYVPHKILNLLVPNHVPKKVRVTYARLALDINETMQATTPVVPEIWSEKLQFEHEISSRGAVYYCRGEDQKKRLAFQASRRSI